MDFEIIRTVDDPLYDRVFTYAKGGPIPKRPSKTVSIKGQSPGYVIYDEIIDFKFKVTDKTITDLVEGWVAGPKYATGSFNGHFNLWGHHA